MSELRRFILAGSMAACLLSCSPVAKAAGELVTKENLDLPHEAAAVQEGDEDRSAEVVAFCGQVFEGDGFFFCCDKSGSMSEGSKFQKLQRELISGISQFSERVQFAICFFDSNLSKFPTNGRPAEAKANMKSAALAFVMSTTTGYGTCAKPALMAALNYANQSSAKRKQIIFLTDGKNSCQGMDPASYEEQTLEEVRAKNLQHVKINTVWWGAQGGDDSFVRRLAEQNSGRASRVTQDPTPPAPPAAAEDNSPPAEEEKPAPPPMNVCPNP